MPTKTETTVITLDECLKLALDKKIKSVVLTAYAIYVNDKTVIELGSIDISKLRDYLNNFDNNEVFNSYLDFSQEIKAQLRKNSSDNFDSYLDSVTLEKIDLRKQFPRLVKVLSSKTTPELIDAILEDYNEELLK